jgi:hypothetical protein
MSQYLGSSIPQSYNVNENHPLIQNHQEYMYIDKFVSIHSEDRDLTKYPNSSEFEIEMPEDLLNVAAIKLVQWTFPANYDTFSAINGNIVLTFRINNPYNPGENRVSDILAERIFEALWTQQELPLTFFIEEGFYNPTQISTELTNKFNYAVTLRITEYFTLKGWTDSLSIFNSNGGYQNFSVVYNNVSLKLWFGNRADGFIILNEVGTIIDAIDPNICISGRSHIPDASLYGLPGYLGLPRCNTQSISGNKITIEPNLANYNDVTVPRFYYGDVNPGDNGFWLLPLDFSGCQVHWVESPYKINLMGEAFMYMEIAGQNCIDETQPYSFSKFTLTSNQTNGIVNSSFAKLPVPSTPLSQWFDRDSVPYKWYSPPAERIRRLKIKIRYHNSRLVSFGVFNFSFTLQFLLMSPQILRNSTTMKYPISNK